MRTLGDIIESTRNGERPEYDELRYAVCALEALLTFDRQAFMNLADAEREGKKPVLTYSADYQWREYFDRTKRAYATDAKEYVGWNNDPDNPEFLQRRRLTVALYDKLASRHKKT